MLSSDSTAKLEFTRVFYKQLAHNLLGEMHNNALETRFYNFQIELFKSYFDNLNESGYVKRFSFGSFSDEEKTQILESVFYYLAQALGTFPLEFLGEEIDLSQKIENNDFMLMQNSLMGARPKAVDSYSIAFLEKQHKAFCENCYFNFLVFLIKRNVKHIRPELHSELLIKSIVAQMDRYNQVLNGKLILNIDVNLTFITDYKDYKKLFCKALKEIDHSCYEEMKSIIEVWGLEVGVVQLFSDIQFFRSESREINIVGEWREFIETNQITECLNEFKKELNSNEQKFHVFIPTNLTYATNWETAKSFCFRFIQVDSIQGYFNQIPDRIQEEITQLKERYSHVIYTEMHHHNRDIGYVEEKIHEKWKLFMNLVHLHENLPTAFRLLIDNSFACSHSPAYEENQTWYRSGMSSSFNVPIDESSFNKKMLYFNKYISPLLHLNNDLAKRFITSLKHNRESLEYQKGNPAFALGSLWLCLEVLSCDFKAEKVAKKLSFAPAILTDEFYSKTAVQNLNENQIKEIYENRKKMYETIIESLGDLRNTLIFHKRENTSYQEWRLKKHIELLRRIVIKTQIVVASELSRDNSLATVEKVRQSMENRMEKGK